MLQHLSYIKSLKKHFKLKDAISVFIAIRNKKEKIYISTLGAELYLRSSTLDLFTFQEVFVNNIYDIKFPIKPKTIIDAGANIGLASVFFHLKYPDAKIVGIEIDTKNYESILKNTKHIPDYKVIKKGLFNKNGFFKVLDLYNASNSFQIKEVAENETFDIESITINQIIKENNWEFVDLLKIDIEGAEKELFESNFENWIPKVKIIAVETHDRMKKDCSFVIFNTLSKYNFILYTTTEGTLYFYNLDLIDLPNL